MTQTLARVMLDPLRDKSYEQTALGRDVVDWLAWLELGGAAPLTRRADRSTSQEN